MFINFVTYLKAIYMRMLLKLSTWTRGSRLKITINQLMFYGLIFYECFLNLENLTSYKMLIIEVCNINRASTIER